MDIRKDHKASYGKWFLSDVMRAVANHGLIDPGDKICVALSGGRDSMTLLYILWYLRNHSHLDFDLYALHVRTDDYDTKVLKGLCSELGIQFLENSLRSGRRIPARNVCSICARLKRGAMAETLRGTGIRKVAFGHHADDVAETLLMNIVYNRRLTSFMPRVEVPGGAIVMIRPLIYLDGPLVKRLHAYFRLPSLFYTCPYADKGARASMRKAVSRMEEQLELKDFSRMVVSALENRDRLSPWTDNEG